MNPTANYFNSVAPEWDMRETTSDARLRHIIESAGVRKGDSVLDVGTGTGILLPYLAEAVGPFGQIDAVDISSEMLARAHEKFSKLPLPVRFMLSDIEADHVHSQYDSIILYNVLPHLQNPLETIMRLFSANLSGGGSLTIAHGASRRAINECHEHIHFPSKKLPAAQALAERLEDAGFPVDYVEDTTEAWVVKLTRH